MMKGTDKDMRQRMQRIIDIMKLDIDFDIHSTYEGETLKLYNLTYSDADNIFCFLRLITRISSELITKWNIDDLIFLYKPSVEERLNILEEYETKEALELLRMEWEYE